LTHALQCLCDGRAGCPARALQLVICRSGGFTGTVTLLFQLVVSLDLVRVGVKIPQDGNRANVYGHVAMVHGHVWCCCPARALQLVICRSGGFTGAVTCCCSVFVMAAGSLLNPFQTVFEAKLATIMASVVTTHTVLVQVVPHCTI
jgi:hypothetical protein